MTMCLCWVRFTLKLNIKVEKQGQNFYSPSIAFIYLKIHTNILPANTFDFKIKNKLNNL